MVGLYAKALRLKAASLKTPPESGGPAVVATGSAGEDVYTPEVWGVPGVWSIPPDDTMGIRMPIGGSDRWGVVVATHHYKAPRPTLAKGETATGATDAPGLELKANTVYRADGTQELNGTGKFLVTHAELNTALQAMVTAINANLALKLNGAGSTGTVTVDISTAKAQTLKTGG